MQIFLTIILFIIGVVLIIRGGDVFVDTSKGIARAFHIKEMIIGATIVSIGTTLPELFTSLLATIKGMSVGADDGFFALAISNAIGSMMCNTGLVLAIAIIINPPTYDRVSFDKSAIYVLLISILLAIFIRTHSKVSTIEGIVLLMLFITYVISNIMSSNKSAQSVCNTYKNVTYSKTKFFILFVLSAIAISVGAMLIVSSSKKLSTILSLSDELIGVTIVAMSTSLPEFVTMISALRKGSSDISVGNILGAHIINATLIVGLISVITGSGLQVDEFTINVSSIVLIALVSFLVLPTLITRKISRWQGVLILITYVSFIIYNAIFVMMK